MVSEHYRRRQARVETRTLPMLYWTGSAYAQPPGRFLVHHGPQMQDDISRRRLAIRSRHAAIKQIKQGEQGE